MALRLRRGVVTALVERHEALIRCEVDGEPCLAYPRLTGDVEIGDEVVVNTQARELDLGTGGFDVLYVNLTRGLDLPAVEGAHVMSLPYTPVQVATRFAEEDVDGSDLAGLPVVCCGLHSQVAPVCAALAGLRVTYVQVAGGALPVSLSDAIRALVSCGLVGETISAAPCLDGDLQCASIASALAVGAARGAEAVVVSVGPGIVGTGSRLGHGGLSVAEAANATVGLGGKVVIAPRVSFGDSRARHQGLSHHTRAAVSLCLGPVSVAWPAGLEPPEGLEVSTVDAGRWREACEGLPLSHMGRSPDEDPWFFEASFAAGLHARGLL